MFRRFSRQARIASALTPSQIADLAQANRLVANGKYLEAAGVFAQLAQQMEATRHPRRAANFHAQAAHVFADANDEPQALAHAQAALRLFIQFQMANRYPRFYANITQKLRNHGMATGATQLEHEFASQVGSIPSSGPTAPQPVPTARNVSSVVPSYRRLVVKTLSPKNFGERVG